MSAPPGTPACTVVVTSRDAMAGLVARDGAHRLALDLLPLGDAVRLLRELIGERADANPEVAAALAGQCCGLPLALRVAAELAVGRPDAALADLTGELAGQHRRLDLLDAGGDPGTAMRAVFSWSYRHLEADAACAFRLVGLHPGSDFDPYAAAALTGTTLERATQLLDTLARAHLIEPTRQGRRYGMHDLLRAYARELAAAQDSEQMRRGALSRLVDCYLYTAAAAMDVMFLRQGRYRQAADRLQQALAVYRKTGNQAGQARHLINLGLVELRLGTYRQASQHLDQALTICRETGDRSSEAEALNSLGEILLAAGRAGGAQVKQAMALDLASQIDDKYEQARAHNGLARSYHANGDLGQARQHWQQALALYTNLGTPEAHHVRTQLAAAGDDGDRQP
jgi:tetratricopeptide (TPR) repeat protein